jgi:hypothetical protein
MNLKLSDKQILRWGMLFFLIQIACVLYCLIFNPRQPDSVHKYSFVANGITIYLTGFECFVIYGFFIVTGIFFWLGYRAFMNNMKGKRDGQNGDR